MRRRLAALAVVGAAVLTAGCTDSDSQPSGPSSPEPTPSPSAGSASTSRPADGGTSATPAPVVATTDLLSWTKVDGDVMDTVVTNGRWTLTVNRSGTSYSLDGPDRSLGASAGPGLKIGDALMDERWAVAVGQDTREDGTRPDRAQVTDLHSGRQFRIDGSSDVPTTSGGTWALGEDTLVHATQGAGGSYCLAVVDLATRRARRGYCVPPRHGFNDTHVSPAATTILSFDDSRPSCRTVGSVSGTSFTPFPGVAACRAWEAVALDPVASTASTVWSVIPKENRIEAADFLARVGDAYYDLGAGTSGTLVGCHDAAYFVRDPQRDGQPASLLRWDGSALATVYQAPPGQSFLQAPRCGQDAITVTALSEGGDEQVTAPLG